MLSNKVDVADETLHAMFAVNRRVREAGETVAAAAGQTHARRMILQAAAGGATVADIARRLGLTRQAIQRITDELVDEGLGDYADNPRHRLSKLFIVTDPGVAVLEQIHRAHARWIAAVIENASSVDWNTLRDQLAHLMQGIEDVEAAGS